jgi:hypothetical protein
MRKKKWKTPKIIVLVRGTPEERVLAACKGDGKFFSGPGPGNYLAMCAVGYGSPPGAGGWGTCNGNNNS